MAASSKICVVHPANRPVVVPTRVLNCALSLLRADPCPHCGTGTAEWAILFRTRRNVPAQCYAHVIDDAEPAMWRFVARSEFRRAPAADDPFRERRHDPAMHDPEKSPTRISVSLYRAGSFFAQ